MNSVVRDAVFSCHATAKLTKNEQDDLDQWNDFDEIRGN